MQPAIVLGSARATIKHKSLEGRRLVVLQPTGVDEMPDGPPLLALDSVGCRKGDRVIATSDGSFAREITKHENTPARWSVVSIVDNGQ